MFEFLINIFDRCFFFLRNLSMLICFQTILPDSFNYKTQEILMIIHLYHIHFIYDLIFFVNLIQYYFII